MNFSEKAFANRIAIICHGIIDSVIVLSYLVEWLKGQCSIVYFLVIIAFALIPVVVEWMVYRKNPQSMFIRHFLAITFGILYDIMIFPTNSIVTYTYALPMLVAVTIYSDAQFGATASILLVAANIVFVIYHAVTVGYQPSEMWDLETRLLTVSLVGLFMFIATLVNKRVGIERMNRMKEHQEKTDQLLRNVLEASEGISTEIAEVSERMQGLGESVVRIQSAMGEVSGGSNETAESIQTQLFQTEQIQSHIGKVKDSAIFIEENMSDTVLAVAEGKKQMDELADQTSKSMDANSQVIAKMEELNEYTRQMNTIIETITSIANSTGMLALNASIEAARAGEAGRGFAVVASEISGLANQTKTATVDITSLIDNINNELSNVARAVDVVTKNNQENVERTKLVAQNFVAIEKGAEKVKVQATELNDTVSELETANSEIVEKIQTISAITEEVSAHSNETYSDCEDNSRMVQEIKEVVIHLNENAEKLKNMKNL